MGLGQTETCSFNTYFMLKLEIIFFLFSSSYNFLMIHYTIIEEK